MRISKIVKCVCGALVGFCALGMLGLCSSCEAPRAYDERNDGSITGCFLAYSLNEEQTESYFNKTRDDDWTWKVYPNEDFNGKLPFSEEIADYINLHHDEYQYYNLSICIVNACENPIDLISVVSCDDDSTDVVVNNPIEFQHEIKPGDLAEITVPVYVNHEKISDDRLDSAFKHLTLSLSFDVVCYKPCLFGGMPSLKTIDRGAIRITNWKIPITD